jgi:ribonucleoside-diphosphate reductase alpha chain
MLLCGTGVGISVQTHHIDKLPKYVKRKGETLVFKPEDSIEGWADCLGVLINSYVGGGSFKKYAGYDIEFDLSNIRPKGSAIDGQPGKAPGPEPLEKALVKIKKLIDDSIGAGKKKLSPIECYDIIMHSSDAVLAGGVRRSALLIMFSKHDKEMINAKTGTWFVENPQRGRSNNSVVLDKKTTTREEFKELARSVKEFGEPGFIWVNDLETLYNPCVEVAMYGYLEDGQSGFQVCNLCEINGKYCSTEERFYDCCRAAAIIGTVQAAYSECDYLGEVSRKIIEREALLGVSITGMMDNSEILFSQEIQKIGAEIVKGENVRIAKLIGINPSARVTCLKPSGSTSCVLGTSSGIHPHHAKRYIRRSQSNKLESPLVFFESINPIAVEESVWSANNTDKVISFCIEVPPGAKTKNDMGAIELLEHVKLTQQNWVKYGKNEDLCVKPWLNHNVSNTITVKDNEWEAVTEYIYENRESFAGISLLSISGDKDYQQAPFTAIYTAQELVKMHGDAALLASGLIVDGLHAFENNIWNACEAVLGMREIPEADTCKDWVRRAQQFASRYFNNDIKNMTYCLKDVYNLHYWIQLQREYKDVDYSLMLEEYDNTDMKAESGCIGGACSLSYV